MSLSIKTNVSALVGSTSLNTAATILRRIEADVMAKSGGRTADAIMDSGGLKIPDSLFANLKAEALAKRDAKVQASSPPPVAARSTIEAFGNQSGKAAETASASAAQDTIPKLSAAQDTVGGSLSQRQRKVTSEELAKAYATVQIQDVDLAKDATNLAMQDIRSQMAASMVQKENHAAANVAQLVR